LLLVVGFLWNSAYGEKRQVYVADAAAPHDQRGERAHATVAPPVGFRRAQDVVVDYLSEVHARRIAESDGAVTDHWAALR
jgi:hypothetical protein